MRKTHYLGFLLLFASFALKVQSKPENERLKITVHKIEVPSDGTLEEALALSREWTENVLLKNENFEEVRMLLTQTADRHYNLLMIYRYAENPVRNTNAINQELIQAHWPEEGAFQKFMQQMQRYINPQNNEVSTYQEIALTRN